MKLSDANSPLEMELLFWMNVAGLPQPDRQVHCVSERQFRFDFAYSEQRLAIEVNGGTWQRQGHSTGRGIARDYEKYNAATLAGWRVLVFSADMVHSGEAVEVIRKALGREA